MTDLTELQRNWELYAKTDPMWAVLMDPDKSGRRWDPDQFFDAGRREIETVLGHLATLGVGPDFDGRALDFGSGVGRLTQALAARFASVIGVDIAPSMVREANKFNRYPEACTYVLNETGDLRALEPATFSFVYTSIVLQHMEVRFAERYLSEFARLLRPGGLLVFQVLDTVKPGASARDRITNALKAQRRHLHLRTRMLRLLRLLRVLPADPGVREALTEMHPTPEHRVRTALDAAGIDVVDVQLTNSTDEDFNGQLMYLRSEPTAGYVSKQYCAVKRGG